MAAIGLADFRLMAQKTVEDLPDPVAIASLRSATALLNKMMSMKVGHVIESIVGGHPDEYLPPSGVIDGGNAYSDFGVNTSGATLTVYGHGLPMTGTVLISGTGLSDLDGVKTFARIDGDKIFIDGVGVPVGGLSDNVGFLSSHEICDCRIANGLVEVQTGPIAKVSEIRKRLDFGQSEDGLYPAESAIDPKRWYFAKHYGKRRTSIEIAPMSRRMTRMRGRILPVEADGVSHVQVHYFVGFDDGIPDDLASAIASFASAMADDPSGMMMSQSFEDYSYTKATAAELKGIPSSALSVVMNYKAGR